MTAYTFSEREIRRIADAVRAYERSGASAIGGRTVPGLMRAIHMGKTDAAIVKGYTGTVSLHRRVLANGGTGITSVDMGIDVAASNTFADVSANVWECVMHDGENWFLTAAEC